MTGQTVASLFEGAPLALAVEHAAQLLAKSLPEASAETEAAYQPSERFTMHRNIAVVNLSGMITPNSIALERWFGWSTCHGIEAAAMELEASEEVSAVVLLCDSPGGSALGVQGAAAAIERLAKVKPVHALIHPLCASAAYWIACHATDITLTHGSWVGSVGVLATSVAWVQPGMNGSQVFVTPSSHAGAKRPDPSTEQGKANIQKMADALEADFLGAVSAGRGFSVDEVKAKFSVSEDPAEGGAVFWGQGAINRGLADYLSTAAEFWARMALEYSPVKPVRKAGRSAQALAAAAQAAADF